MAIDATYTWAGTPDAALALLTDEQFLRDRGKALGAEVDDVTVSGTETVSRLAAPTQGIPPMFAKFVGSSVAFVETTTWTPDGAGGHRAALDARAEIFGRSAIVSGERRLVPDGAGTRSTVHADVTVNAPFIGGQAASAVGQLVELVLRREDELVRQRL
ncbi:DUF2505 domain-containing protein [Modestobacter sp. NPDC049651]|uniref:DUF2505 domain-containing protein n=1 Tax=unclassified Modestobacter TaxID=2643866 RepID=UPI00340ED580